jgi:hypothetical protein
MLSNTILFDEKGLIIADQYGVAKLGILETGGDPESHSVKNPSSGHDCSKLSN